MVLNFGFDLERIVNLILTMKESGNCNYFSKISNEEQAKEAARFLKDQVTVRDLNMGITQEGSILKGSQQAQRTTQGGSIPNGTGQNQQSRTPLRLSRVRNSGNQEQNR